MTAPAFNSFNALTGDVAPSNPKFWEALAEADSLCSLEDENVRLRASLEDAELELAELKDRNLRLVNTVACMRTQLARAEAAK
jgi:hypothetical protein